MSGLPANPLDTFAEAAELLTGCPDEEVAEECAAAVIQARAAVAELVALARKLRLDREGIENTREKFCAPVLDVADVRAFTAALAQFGGAA